MFIIAVSIFFLPIAFAAFGYPWLLKWTAIIVAVTVVLALGFFTGLLFTWISSTSEGWKEYDLEHAMSTVLLSRMYLDYIADKPFILNFLLVHVVFLDFYREYFKISFFHKINFILWSCEAMTFYIIYAHARALSFLFMEPKEFKPVRVVPEVEKNVDYYREKEKRALQDLFDSREQR